METQFPRNELRQRLAGILGDRRQHHRVEQTRGQANCQRPKQPLGRRRGRERVAGRDGVFAPCHEDIQLLAEQDQRHGQRPEEEPRIKVRPQREQPRQETRFAPRSRPPRHPEEDDQRGGQKQDGHGDRSEREVERGRDDSQRPDDRPRPQCVPRSASSASNPNAAANIPALTATSVAPDGSTEYSAYRPSEYSHDVSAQARPSPTKLNGSVPGVYFPSAMRRPVARWSHTSELRAVNDAARNATISTMMPRAMSTAPNHSGHVAGLATGVGVGAAATVSGGVADSGAGGGVASDGVAFTRCPRMNGVSVGSARGRSRTAPGTRAPSWGCGSELKTFQSPPAPGTPAWTRPDDAPTPLRSARAARRVGSARGAALMCGSGPGRPVAHPMSAPEFLIGGADGCDVRLPGSHLPPIVCRLTHAPDGLTLRRVDPAFPVLVNDTPVSGTDPVRLSNGDRLAVGPPTSRSSWPRATSARSSSHGPAILSPECSFPA